MPTPLINTPPFTRRSLFGRAALLGVAATCAGTAFTGAQSAFAPLPARASDWSLDRILTTVQGEHFGRGRSERTDASVLGWSGSLFMNGMVQAWKATSNPSWLEQIIDCTDRLISHTADHDNDGFLGWQDCEASFTQVPNAPERPTAFPVEGPPAGTAGLLVNGDFEDGLTGWTQVGSPTGTVHTTNPAEAFAGSGAVTVRTDADGTTNMLTQQISCTPGRNHVVEAMVNTQKAAADGATNGKIEIVDPATGEIVYEKYTVHCAWEPYAGNFIAPASGLIELRLRLYDYSHDGWWAQFDNVQITELPEQPEIYQTEAWGWTRGEGTTLAMGHRTNDPAARGSKTRAYRLIRTGGVTPSVWAPFSTGYAPETEYRVNTGVLLGGGAIGRMELIDLTTDETLFSADPVPDEVYLGRFRTPEAGHDLRWVISVPEGPDGAWMSVYQLTVGVSVEQQILDAQIIMPALEVAIAVHDDPALERYREKADSYVRFVADHLVHKWDRNWRQLSGTDGENNGTGVYLNALDNGVNSHGRALPHNMYMAYAAMLYLLHDATAGMPEYASERPFYLSRANDLQRNFKQKLLPHPLNAERDTDAYFWKYSQYHGPWDGGYWRWDTDYYNREDTGHAGITMRGVLMAYQRGQVWDSHDIRRFANTFLDIMWNGSLEDPLLAANNDGLDQSASSLNQMRHWAMWGEVDPGFYEMARAKFTRARGGNLDDDVQLARFARNKVINPRFEWRNPHDAELPMYWERLPGDRRVDVRSLGPTLAHRRVRLLGSSSGLGQQLVEYVPGASYTVWLRGEARRTATAALVDRTTGEVLGSAVLDGSGTAQTTIGALPADDDHELWVEVTSDGPADIAEVRALPEPWRTEIGNGDFESAEWGSADLPRFWRRGPATLTTHVGLDTTVRQAGYSSLKLAAASDGSRQELAYDWTGRPTALGGWTGYHHKDADYVVEAWGRCDGVGGVLEIVDLTTDEQLARLHFTGSDWEHRTATFRTPTEHDHVLGITITHDVDAPTSGTFWLDTLGVSVVAP